MDDQRNEPTSAPAEPQVNPPSPVSEQVRPSEGERKEQEQPSQQQPQQQSKDRRFRHQRQRNQGFRHEGQQQQQQRDGKKEISVVIPLLNEEQSLPELYDKLRSALNRFGRFELIFVDDGSTDGSHRVLQDLRRRDRRVKIIRFRRNYGKSAALSVGFANATGDIVITMDADLQDDPAEIPNLISEIKKGYDLVSGWKKKRRDPITKTIPSRFFNFVTSVMTGIKLHDFNCGLKAYRKEVTKDVKIYGELHRYIPVLAQWAGYKIGEIPVQHHARKFGKTKFGLGRFWKGFLDLLTVIFTTRYMQRPLHLFGFWGIVFFLAGFAIDLYLAILKFADGMSLSNRPLFLGGILLIIVGIQFISVGLIGELVTKTRPTDEKEYSIREIWK
ncbi:MAG TPA: glycosyltransferase family 2 protein [Bacteroidota bacterium]|nr:glycosyltransferase family 2 protein [Bacteroidota bacterium]